jgi:hypothetical protein
MPKNKNVIQPIKLELTREQIDKLSQIAEHFKEVKEFTIVRTYESGIGATDRIHFTLFDKNDSNIDVTDVSNW